MIAKMHTDKVRNPPAVRWSRKCGRWRYGPHAWVTSRGQLEKAGMIMAFLDWQLKWRGAWMDKVNRMHWQWFPDRAKAMEWTQMMAHSSNAKPFNEPTA